MEKFKTYFLMTGLTLLFIWFGGLIGGKSGMIIAFLIAAGMNFYAYYYSDKQVLAHYDAVPVDEQSAPGLYAIVRRLTQRAGLPMPRLYIIPDPVENPRLEIHLHAKYFKSWYAWVFPHKNSLTVGCACDPKMMSARKLKELAKDGERLVDVTEGRRTRSLLVMDSNHVILSSIQPDTISQRLATLQLGPNVNAALKGRELE
jgi:regulator of extracellular matrix RemA (YlzA/DUF370 family)